MGNGNSRKVGIERITAYPCSMSLDMAELAKARGVSPSHPLEELWVDQRALNPVWEDPVTMAVNAARRITRGIEQDIELVVVGTESSPDFGKPISTYVQRYCELTPNCRNFESKHACYGGTSALMMAAHWIASGVAPGKKALVVTTDQSRMHLHKPWEFVLGAASVAMVISEVPDVLELELQHNGYWTNEIFDTYRPTARNEVGHAETSLFGYLDALEGSFEHFMKKAGEPAYDETFKKHIYHVPFGGMTYRAHRAIARKTGMKGKAQIKENFERKSKPALKYNRRFGGSYTSATFAALLGLIDSSEDLNAGDRISIFSYGSGSCSEFYSARMGEKAKAWVAGQELSARFDARRQVSVPEYEAIEQKRTELIDQPTYTIDKSTPSGLYDSVYEGQGLLVLDGVDDWERKYRLS